MKHTKTLSFAASVILMSGLVACSAVGKDNHKGPASEDGKISLKTYPTDPPFDVTKLKPAAKMISNGKAEAYYAPKNRYNIFVNYELGMHCVGFEMSYCCVIPPYNSIQAQVVQSGTEGSLPKLLSPDDNVKLYYYTKNNSYSKGNKMKYWSVPKDVDGDGHFDSPGDNVANYVWTHLFIYKDLEGTIPTGASEKDRLRIGKQIRVRFDSGPSGKPMAGGYMDYAGREGGNIVFTDTLVPAVKNVPLTLTSAYVWDALGLPLTAFNDSRRKGTIRSITEKDFNPINTRPYSCTPPTANRFSTKISRSSNISGPTPSISPTVTRATPEKGKRPRWPEKRG